MEQPIFDIKNSKLLIVDDDPRNRKLLEVIFKQEMQKIIQAEDGIDAIEKIKQDIPDLILLDIMMPRMDGFSVIEKLKENEEFKEIPIVLVTALNDQDTITKGLSLGAEDYITKPFYNKEVKLRVRNILKIKKANELLRKNNKILKETDSLTGLPNRQTTRFIYNGMLSKSDNVGFIVIEIDQLKQITLGLGANATDKVIVSSSKKLEKCVTDSSVIGYLSGGKFIVLIPSCDLEKIESTVKCIFSELEKSIKVEGKEIFLRLSAGSAITEKDKQDFYSNLRMAEAALNIAETKKENSHQHYSEKAVDDHRKTLDISSSLHNAIKNNELILYYQPIVNLFTNKIVGVEALTRWKKDGKFIMPNEFMHLVESTGLLQEFHNWTINKAVTSMSKLPTLKENFYISVNISPSLFYSEQLFDEVISKFFNAIQEKNVVLALEITEECAIQDTHKATRIIKKLQQSNIKVILDDFGTGYSSFGHLNDLPVESIKIDKIFIDSIPDNNISNKIISSIVSLADDLGIQVVAEGVEKQAQIDYLRSINCKNIQGYYFYKPLPEEEFIKVLKSNLDN